jgi:hypothetical protein
MRGLTFTESRKVTEIMARLSSISSPVLRLQAILQFSQIVDILAIGDTNAVREQDLVQRVDELTVQSSPDVE